MFIQRKKRERSGIRDLDGPIRLPSHLKFVRGCVCVLAGKSRPVGDMSIPHECEGRMEAAHVRCGTNGGTSLKPGDNYTIPLCSTAHREQHQIGEPAFERRYSINMKALAEAHWGASPHGKKWRMENGS